MHRPTAAIWRTPTGQAGCCPRFKDWEFRIRSEHGPIDGATLLDWPIGLSDLEPYYEAAEDRLGVTRTNGIPAPPANNGIPQNNGGDSDSDNNGGASDGDGNI